MVTKREELNLDKTVFRIVGRHVNAGWVPYSKNYYEEMHNTTKEYDCRDDKGKCISLTGHIQHHLWDFGEIPTYDQLKEYINVKMDKTMNKHIIAINNNFEWISELLIKPKYKTRFKKRGYKVEGSV
ncbi:MAG: hypothetical protein ACREV6_20500 [Clostridium sp.]|uniref:hypothetical protein n=1 Tax=Clostridium sp. TaxID=1506 RepID=UPI003D6C879E